MADEVYLLWQMKYIFLEKDAACCVSGDVLPRAFKSHAGSTSPLFVDSKGTVDHVGQCGIVCLALKCLAA